ncbi:MAG: outer membrane beta-barrel protein [Verrucomicrobiota bacterium]
MVAFTLFGNPFDLAQSAQNEDVESKVAAAILQLIARGDANPSDVGILVEDFIIVDPTTAPDAVKGALELLKDYEDVVERVVKGAVELAPEQAEEIVAAAIDVAPELESTIRKTAADSVVSSEPEEEKTPYVEVSTFVPEDEVREGETRSQISDSRLGVMLDRRLAGFAEAGSALVIPANQAEPGMRVGFESGFDSNRRNSPDAEGSGFVSGKLAATGSLETGRAQVQSHIRGGATHFFDGLPNLDETFYDAESRLFAQYSVTDRVSVSNQFRFELDHEADLLSGVATARRVGQYRHLYNRVAIALQASDSLSGSLSYGLSNIAFEEEELARSEDRFSHIVGAMVKKQIGSRTAVSNTYQYSRTNYDQADQDYRSHLVLLGVDHQFSPQLRASIGVGAEMRRYIDPGIGRRSLPFVESNLIFLRNSAAQLRVFSRFGLDDRELSLLGFQSRQSFRSGVELAVEVAPKVTVTAELDYLRSQFEGGAGLHEDALLAAITGRYQVGENLFLTTGYSFGAAMSAQDSRDFDRHRVWTGLTGAF